MFAATTEQYKTRAFCKEGKSWEAFGNGKNLFDWERRINQYNASA